MGRIHQNYKAAYKLNKNRRQYANCKCRYSRWNANWSIWPSD